MLQLRAHLLRRLRGPAALCVFDCCSETCDEAQETAKCAVHRLQPPRMHEPEMQDLSPLPRTDVPGRQTLQRGNPTSQLEAAAEYHRRQAAVPVRGLPLSAMPHMQEADAQRRMPTKVPGERGDNLDVRGLFDGREE